MRNGKKKAAVILIIVAAVGLITAGVILVVSALSDSNKKSEKILEGDEIHENWDKPLNIVFLGIDKQENRSDVMMVISINRKENTINVVSILRDSKVDVEGCSVGTKIGYAYKWGGTSLAIKTINSSFGTSLRKYITMHFEDVETIVDSLGGVEVDVSDEEAELINQSAKSNGYNGADIGAGVNNLCGKQAVAYARIRKVGGEYGRASRQQTVIQSMLGKLRKMTRDEQLSFIDLISENMNTNMFMDEFTDLTKMDMSSLKLNEYTIPDEDYETDLWSGWEDTPETVASDPLLDSSQWLWIYDLDKASERLKSYIGE